MLQSSVVPTAIQWSLPEDNILQGNGTVSGNCTLTSNPPPIGKINIMNCEYRSSATEVDKYTVTINFIIYRVMHVMQSCLIYCRSTTHEEAKTLVVGAVTTVNTNTTNSFISSPTNNSMPTPLANPSEMLNQTTPISNTTTPTPIATEHRVNTESNQEQTNAIIIMLILIVVVLMLLAIFTTATLTLVIWMTIRVSKSKMIEP